MATNGSNGTKFRRINLVRIAHVYYTHKNIDAAKTFLDDFGFQETLTSGTDTYYRGTGTDPFVYCATAGSEDVFGGAAFVVESREDLDYAAETLPGATPVHEMKEQPGGGFRVTFKDPVDGFPFHLVYGQTPVEESDAGLLQRRFNFVSSLDFCRATGPFDPNSYDHIRVSAHSQDTARK